MHRYPLLQYGLRLVSRPDIVEDAVSDAFALLAQNIGKFANGEHIHNYLYSVVRNKCWTARREVQRCIPLPEDAGHMSDPGALESMEIKESEVHVQFLIHVIYAALERLPRQRRKDFYAYFFESKSCSEIARRRGISVPTVHQNIELALKMIKESLKEKGCL